MVSYGRNLLKPARALQVLENENCVMRLKIPAMRLGAHRRIFSGSRV